jgi:cold shock protein
MIRSIPVPGTSHTGTVKLYNTKKEFAFITPSDGGADVFVHQSAARRADITRGLFAIGTAVTYTVSTDALGRPRAETIRFRDVDSD